MRTIAIISEHASPLADLGGVDSGGQNVYVAQIARNLASLGYQVDIFTRRDDKALPEIYDWTDRIRVIHVPAGPAEYVRKEDLFSYMGAFSAYMIDFLQRQGKPYDLVHANFWMSALVAADIKRALGIPFVVTFHALGRVRRQYQGRNDGFPDARFDAEQRIVQEADGIVAECPQDRDDLIHFYTADPARIREIPCGFDPRELWPINRRAAQRQVGLRGNEWTVLQLGRMVPRKGVDTAIRGFAQMLREHDVEARMLVVGGASREPDVSLTPEIGRLRQIAAEEGVLDHVLFSGRRNREELKYYYSAAHVFISTPWYEPFGITPLEAMACGTPVIGARVGGIKHTVLDGETGYLVPPRDPQAIADCLIDLYRNPAKLERFRQGSLRRVHEYFTWHKVSQSLADFYEQVLGATRIVVGAPAAHGFATAEEADELEDLGIVQQGFTSAIQAFERSKEILDTPILEASRLLVECLNRGGKILTCGNGGSAADAQHFAAELVGRFMAANRRGLPVIALTADTAFLTAWANDIGYEQIFARQVQALGQPGDVLVGISTSGRSPNIIRAFEQARAAGIRCVALLGADGGELLPISDAAIVVPSWSTQRIQEVHTLVMHTLCEIVEKRASAAASQPSLELARSSVARSAQTTMLLSDAER
jgi:D-inositol-3-phosphate glycosyltransferase